MRILIVKLGSIGDIVHTLPALAAIRRSAPEAHLSWVVERGAAEVLRDNPALNDLIEIDTRALRRRPLAARGEWSLASQFGRLRRLKYDVAIDFQGLLKSAFVAALSGAKRRVGFSREFLREPMSRLLMTEGFEVPPRAHVTRRNLALASAAFGINATETDLQFPLGVLPSHEAEAAEAMLKLCGRDGNAASFAIPNQFAIANQFAILNPGGGWWTKQWSAERFGQLADLLWERDGLPSLVTYGPGEERLAACVESASRTRAARGVTLTLRGFFALARQARIYVGSDTGPTHLAIAAGAPIVGLFGPTEWWRNGSPQADDIVVERMDIGCREDCHRRACGQWVCMDIAVESVYGAARERLRRREAARESSVLVDRREVEVRV